MTASADILNSKKSASRWAELFRRALPECTDVEEAIAVADVALELPESAALSVDASGHEHKGKGEGGGQFVKKHGERANESHTKYHELIAQAKKSRVDAFNSVKEDAKAAKDKASEHFQKISENSDNIASAEGPMRDAYNELDSLKSEEYESPADQFSHLKEIEAKAKEVLKLSDNAKSPEGEEEADDELSNETKKVNATHLTAIIQNAQEARKQIKAYIQHRKEMKAIREGSPMDVQLSMIDLADDPQKIDAMLAHDIFNRKAQGILNRAVDAAKKLGSAARIDLERSLRTTDREELSRAINAFISRYRVRLADLITTTQLAALLEGARDVAKSIPTVPMFPGAAVPPATLEPIKAIELLEELSLLPTGEREQRLYDLPHDQQQFVRHGLLARQHGGIEPPTTFTPAAPVGDAPERIHYPIIDEAAQSLAAKNVMTRTQFDSLDSASRQKAFTVAHVESMDTLNKIQEALVDTVGQGADYEAFRERVMLVVDAGTFMSDAHMETVFRTTVQTAFSDGQAKVLEHPFVRGGFPYASYFCIRDDRVRPHHKDLETLGIQGTNIYRVNDPVFITFRPPWDYCDRCSWVPMTVRQAASKDIQEAKDWLETGVEPYPPAFVEMPSFQPPAGFQRSLMGMQLALTPIAFSWPKEVFLAVKEENGKWITIGGSKGEDGKRHGGSPVFVVGGRITKGNPKLTGRKLGSLDNESDDGKTHRQQMNQEKEYQRAKWAKKVRELGVKPKALHQLADEMKDHHDAHQSDVKKMLQETRDKAKKLGVNVHHKSKEFEGGDYAKMEGFDLLARSMASEYPHLLGDHGYDSERGYDDSADEASAKLFDFLSAGNPELMSEADAYEQAYDYLAENHASKKKEAEESSSIPFSLSSQQDAEYVSYLEHLERMYHE